ncbi:hypothetical protein [Clostridium sp. FP1]|uniref:hypothetical protein n=1 Tax=Clostridium sp. FP1 TaxID=2724076 RepID=UPI0013E98314|nr:hypothetical protein [Clostridium sp. FP1]MBZ9637706.1 hypothetical protein [Clostridium sp. FP1]
MKQKMRINLLGVYDLILSLGAIFIGIIMVSSRNGIFIEYPKEWLSKVPFESWVTPGIIAIVVFGLGNIISAIFVFRKESNKSWVMSAIMGGIFFMSIVAQVVILGEWYMATVQFLIFSIIQICLSGYVFSGYRKNLMSSKVL